MNDRATRTIKRRHHKVSELPEAIRLEISHLLNDEGKTYQEIEDHLKTLGHPVGHSSVQRWHSNITEVAERMKLVREHVKVLAEEARDNPNTEAAEVANELMVSGAIQAMMNGGMDMLANADPIQVGRMLADLERSRVARERLKMQAKDKTEKALAKIEEKVQKVTNKELDPETKRIIREEMYGLGQQAA